MIELSKSQKQSLLYFDVFDGDFGDPGDKCLENKIVKCKKENKCHGCGENTEIGTFNLVKKMIWADDGKLVSYRWCQNCCNKMLNEEY